VQGILDMGGLVNADIAGVGHTRFAQVARPK